MFELYGTRPATGKKKPVFVCVLRFRAINRLEAVVKMGQYIEKYLGEWKPKYDEIVLLTPPEKLGVVTTQTQFASVDILLIGGK